MKSSLIDDHIKLLTRLEPSPKIEIKTHHSAWAANEATGKTPRNKKII